MSKNKSVLVCVTPQESSKFLVNSGRAIADKLGLKLEIICVLPVNSGVDKDVLERLYEMGMKANADTNVYFNDEPILTVAAYIAKTKPHVLVAGFPGENSNDFVSSIHLMQPQVPISMVSSDGTIYNMLPLEETKSTARV